ncbi:MAG: sugar ABC transporter ATP-binding protein [Proteobacteria bacterium]|nr:sugar ABC transporter ATP-binding protein [Pseudomonadota bacterium]
MHKFLEVRGLTKRYGSTVALRNVDFEVSQGEALGLVGENGAGKSTLMKVLGGVVAPDAGTITIADRSHDKLTVQQSMASGIAFVHQELNLFENLTAAANIFIGREATRGGPLRLLDDRTLAARAKPLLAQLGADFSPEIMVEDLSLAQRQMVEIAKALSLEARLVIMDEPTSSLTQSETERLLETIRKLSASGVATIFISHRLGEVKQCCSRVAVLRDGETVAMLKGKDVTPENMIRHMIGRDLKSVYRAPAQAAGEDMLAMTGLRTAYRPLSEVNLALRAGEILGLAGLVGSGRTELARVIAGIEPALGGSMRFAGKELVVAAPSDAIARGIYLVPEDRKGAGLVLDFPIAQNVTMPDLKRYARHLLVDARLESHTANAQKESLDLRCSSVAQAAGELSGGNQQKVALAKWLAMSPKVLVMDEPTRGIDVGAKDEIYRIMRQLADSGVAILMISSDMEEVIGVSDRIAVMHEGRIAGILSRGEFSEERILALAVGRHAQQEAAA